MQQKPALAYGVKKVEYAKRVREIQIGQRRCRSKRGKRRHFRWPTEGFQLSLKNSPIVIAL